MPSDVVILASKTETKTDTKTEMKSAAIIGSAFCICVHLCLIVLVVFDVFAERQLEHG